MKHYKNRSRILCSILIVSVLLVSSCSSSAVAPEQPASTVAPSATIPVFADTSTPLPTIEVLPTPIIQPTATTSEQNCLTLENQLPSDLYLSGTWIRGKAKPYLEDIETGSKIGIPLNGNSVLSTYDGDFAISHDSKWFAYIDTYIKGTGTDKRILRVMSSSGYSLNMDYWPANFQLIHGWNQTGNLLLETNFPSDQHRNYIFLNPSTGKYEVIDINWLRNFKSEYYSEFFIAPSANFMAITIQGLPNDRLEVRNVITNDPTIDDIAGDFFLSEVAWAPDSSILAIESDNKALLINPNEPDQNYSFGMQGYIRELKWSMNGKSLLILGDSLISILDLETKINKNYCINDENFEYEWRHALWSPDDRFIIINGFRRIYPYKYPFELEPLDVLIDVRQERAFHLQAEFDTYRKAWLDKP